jgi:hypothetical protein
MMIVLTYIIVLNPPLLVVHFLLKANIRRIIVVLLKRGEEYLFGMVKKILFLTLEVFYLQADLNIKKSKICQILNQKLLRLS